MTTKINVVPASRKPPSTDDQKDLELPFAWEPGTGATKDAEREQRFRFPAPDDPKPQLRRLFGVAIGASLIGLISLAISARALLEIVSGPTPAWYGPLVAVADLACVAPAIGAFLSIHRRRLPWILLLIAVLPLAAGAVVTVHAG